MSSIQKPREFNRQLPVRLRSDEVREKAALLAAKVEDRAVTEVKLAAELKTAKEAATTQLTELSNEVTKLAREVRTQHELRDVACQESPNIEDRTMEVLRLDTGEVIESRELSAHEIEALRQLKLKLVTRGKNAEAAE